MINKFYIGAAHIADAIHEQRNDTHTHKTLDSAIKEGKEILIEEDRDCVIIVQIVRIIKHKDSPVIVERV